MNQMNWDLSSFFPAIDSTEYAEFKSALQHDIAELQKQASSLSTLATDNLEQWEAVFLSREEMIARCSHIGSYVGALSAADAHNEAFANELAAVGLIEAESEKVEVELLRGLKDATAQDFNCFLARSALSDCEYQIERMRKQTRWSMPLDKEILATDLAVDGYHAWGRLYETMSGKLEFDMNYPDGRTERLPVSQRRSLMQHPDRSVREAAFEDGNRAWESIEDVAASALNAISGTRLALDRHRKVDHFLDRGLFQAAITRNTLEAMFQAIFDNADLAKRVLRLRAAAMGVDALAWYDMEAPFPLPDQGPISWQEGKQLVASAFERVYGDLAEFLQVMHERCWIESEPRPGKRPGAFCTGSLLTKEARIYMTYNETLGDVRTLAHEAGHAYHGYVMRDMRPMAHMYPMTLAESASTFAEMILTDGLLTDSQLSSLERARILDMEIGHAATYLLDIPVRFEFEKSLYEERKAGVLSISRLKELMAATQRRVLGDVLAADGVDPLFWASKMHFYFTHVMFYNFPYTFGYLLSRGLFALFKTRGGDFLPEYEEFLRKSGSDAPEKIARQTIGCDLEAPAFWTQAIQSIARPLVELESLVPEVASLS